MANFQELINGETPVLVDFWAEWCGPCHMQTPILEDVARKLGEQVKIVKVNVDQNPAAAQAFAIQSIPTLLLFKQGQVVWRKSGVQTAAAIEQAVQQVHVSA
jgi:thioredoxin 1